MILTIYHYIIEFNKDNHSINEAVAEMSAVAEADTIGLSEAVCKEPQPTSGEVELSLGFTFNVQDKASVREGDTKATPNAGLSMLL